MFYQQYHFIAGRPPPHTDLRRWTRQGRIEHLLPRIRQLDEESPLTLVYTSNLWQGQAAVTARQLRMLMEGEKAE